MTTTGTGIEEGVLLTGKEGAGIAKHKKTGKGSPSTPTTGEDRKREVTWDNLEFRKTPAQWLSRWPKSTERR